MRKHIIIGGAYVILSLLISLPAAADFDHSHRLWDQLLHRHVIWLQGGHASRIDYAAMMRDQARLNTYLDSLSAVTDSDFETWTPAKKMAFLINAYNAFTVELILKQYPHLQSIKDIGGFFSSPWKKRFISLLGEERSLDDIEHKMIRSNFRDPRVHFALNCASVGCPAIRGEAYVASRLDAQLNDSLTRFLSDPSRNRYEPQRHRLVISKIFDWYSEDWQQNAIGTSGVADFLAHHASLLTKEPDAMQLIAHKQVTISYGPYDWRLNDIDLRSMIYEQHQPASDAPAG